MVAVLLVLDVAVVVRRREQGQPNVLAQRIEAIDRIGPKPDPALVASIDAATRELQAFVSTTRGLKFTRAVKVRVLNDVQFNALGAASYPTAAQRRHVQDDLDVLRALKFAGRLDPSRLARARVEETGGIYSPALREVLVRGETVTPALRVTLVHELTHALDDEHFHLRTNPKSDDSALSYAAVVEGDAVVVTNRYRASLPIADQQALAAGNPARSPVVAAAQAVIGPRLLRLLQFPYAAGASFVNALAAGGGETRIDAAFRHPPESTAEITDPSRYLFPPGRRPSATSPPSRGRTFQRGSLGAFQLRLLLEEALPPVKARSAVEEWGDDAYVAWHEGPNTCVRDRVVAVPRASGALLAGAFYDWAAESGASVQQPSSGESFVFTVCG